MLCRYEFVSIEKNPQKYEILWNKIFCKAFHAQNFRKNLLFWTFSQKFDKSSEPAEFIGRRAAY